MESEGTRKGSEGKEGRREREREEKGKGEDANVINYIIELSSWKDILTRVKLWDLLRLKDQLGKSGNI